jgi:hypothetical protein
LRSFAVCDRCGFLFNHPDLTFQYQWQGVKLQNKRILVCENCSDKPSQFLRAITLPPDPLPIFNPRPEFYSIDEAGSYQPPSWLQIFDTPGSAFYIVPQGASFVEFQCLSAGSVNTTSQFDGAGGGAWAKTLKVPVSAGLLIYFHVAAVNEPSWARFLANSPPSTKADGCYAAAALNIHGGPAASCIGDLAYSGGDGGSAGYGDGGGGGAAGPLGPGGKGAHGAVAGNHGGGAGGGGANGGAAALNIGSQAEGGAGGAGGFTGSVAGVGGTAGILNGGAGVLGGGGGGGYALATATGGGGTGGSDKAFDALHGCGGGGGGAGSSSTGAARAGGNGGRYGGGGGGGDAAQGTSGTGLVVMRFT